jgi:hypothetical protein
MKKIPNELGSQKRNASCSLPVKGDWYSLIYDQVRRAMCRHYSEAVKAKFLKVVTAIKDIMLSPPQRL